MDGNLHQVGWARYPILECNLENAAFYPRLFRSFQFARVKRWDYYAIFTPERFFSATIANLGYAGNVFVYVLDLDNHDLHEESMVIPLGHGVNLSRQTIGTCEYLGKEAQLIFETLPNDRKIRVNWPSFHQGRGIQADISLEVKPRHESMNIVIPISPKKFYYNHKINCLPASGVLQYGNTQETLDPAESLGQLDWGRGVWEYSSFWNWASASGYLPDGRTIGLNLGCGFGDTRYATENALILDGRIHKMDAVSFDYDAGDYMKTWKFHDNEGKLKLDFLPFKERLATTRLVLIDSEVHQMFGRFTGRVVTDEGEAIHMDGLVGFAEEHRARW